ncbi:hypothetical protein [Paractinoplanes deccanensis]|uniref:hypothetical protein n=1 Tax=Paractinoplanes deccanensis TaxID=113561 RepID=UPI001EF1B9F7|nr:hypothetical protein [Actinoplanes deccanensis]
MPGGRVDELRRIAAKNTTVFGFVTPTTKPCTRVRRSPIGAARASNASRNARRWRTA